MYRVFTDQANKFMPYNNSTLTLIRKKLPWEGLASSASYKCIGLFIFDLKNNQLILLIRKHPVVLWARGLKQFAFEIWLRNVGRKGKIEII